MSEPAETFIEFQKAQKHRSSKQRKYCSNKEQRTFSEMYESVKKAFLSFKNTEKHVIWETDIPYHIITALFSRSKCDEKGCDLAKIQYQVAHNC